MLNSLKGLVDTDILSLLTPKRQLVGLDIGSSGIKLVQLKENRGRYVLQKFGFVADKVVQAAESQIAKHSPARNSRQ